MLYYKNQYYLYNKILKSLNVRYEEIFGDKSRYVDNLLFQLNNSINNKKDFLNQLIVTREFLLNLKELLINKKINIYFQLFMIDSYQDIISTIETIISMDIQTTENVPYLNILIENLYKIWDGYRNFNILYCFSDTKITSYLINNINNMKKEVDKINKDNFYGKNEVINNNSKIMINKISDYYTFKKYN